MASSIKLYKTFKQLVLETYRVGDVYTYTNYSKLQISEIDIDSGIFVKYTVKGAYMNNSFINVTPIIGFIELINDYTPISIYLGNEELWE